MKEQKSHIDLRVSPEKKQKIDYIAAKCVLTTSEYYDCTPSYAQAVRLRKESAEKYCILTPDRIFKILGEEKANQREKVSFQVGDLRKYFPDNYTAKEMQNTILRLLLRTLRECTDITELNREIVNRLIRRIEVHNNDKSSGHCHVQVDIYFTGVGMVDLPTEQEMLALMDEIRIAKNNEIPA